MHPLESGTISDAEGDFFVAADRAMLRVRELAERVAQTAAPVLIIGETGVGKEVVARFIHSRSPRSPFAFVKINCAAAPHDRLESELFGHERGPFAGAQHRAEGRFELAHQGTLLLDEIGEMGLALQAKLLHVVEDCEVTHVGSTRSLPVDARLIATSTEPLDRAVARGEFRKDLYFRLKAVRLHVPPLRERRQDIALLCEHFVRLDSRPGTKTPRIPQRLLAAFLSYSWPGNVRELRYAVQRYLLLPDVEMALAELRAPREDEPLEPAAAAEERLRLTVDLAPIGRGQISLKPLAAKAAEEAEKRVIMQVLDETHWNRRRAAARLDICYKTLLNKLHAWRLETDTLALPDR